MSTNKIFFAAGLAVAAFAASLLGYGTGAIPGTIGTSGTVPTDVTRRVPGCGVCHRQFPGGNNLQVALLPTARSLELGQSISVTTSATGGQAHPLDWGGFVAEATAGAFSAGSNSQIDPTGSFVTHLLAQTSNHRTWTYGYTAPSVPGPVELYAVVNTVDGDGQPGGGDLWGYHGYYGFAFDSTPVRLFVNAPGVKGLGEGCVGSFGNYPVLGASTPPTVGNAAFAFELSGAAPGAPAVFLFGLPRPTPIDLSVVGITGCSLWVDSFADAGATTGPGNALMGEGSATAPLPIPNLPNLSGVLFAAQCAIIDALNGRSTGVTLSNALTVRIQ